ncbi:KP4 killer toxin [Metarhizium anisopliae]
MVSLSIVATFVASAAALGINCRGSGGCTFNNAKLSDVLTQVKQIQAQGNGNHHYNTAVQLACAQGQYSSICAFYQNGASGTANDAAGQLQGLIDHKCSQCGSIPTQPGNDVSKGELTVNIVSAPCCKGNCVCPI